MPYTVEPRGLAFVNNINTNSAGSLTTQLAFLIGSLILTKADYHLLLGPTDAHRSAGLLLAGILVGAWTSKTVAGVVDSNNKRKADPKYAEVIKAQTEGHASAAAAAVVIADKAADLKATLEHPVPPNGH